MPKSHLPFGEIVATPTVDGWSQAYSAGGFFVTLSLSYTDGETEEKLGVLGKKLLNDLEAEFFTLEDKSLNSIKEVIEKTFSPTNNSITISSAISYVKDNILYLFLYGNGSIRIRRNGAFGTLLEEKNAESATTQAASGPLQPQDLVVLQTKHFQEVISEEKLNEVISTTSAEEIAEILSPLVHNAEVGGAAAIFFTFLPQEENAPKEEEERDDEVISENKDEERNIEHEEIIATSPTINQPPPATNYPPLSREEDTDTNQLPIQSPIQKMISALYSRLPILRSRLSRLSHRQRVLGSIAILLVGILLISIFFTTRNTKTKANRVTFTKSYEPAKRHFEEGQGLLELNTQLAREELLESQKILNDALKKIPANSEEGKKLTELKKQVDETLEGASGATKANATEAPSGASPLLSVKNGSSNRLFVTKGEESIYALTKGGILSFPKNGEGESKTLVKNDDDWKTPAGLGTFASNIYVLDKSEGVLKFSPSGDDFGKSSYFTGTKPDVSKAVSLAIDSSIYILLSSGDVLKFTRGASDSFTVSGLDTPFKNPTRVFTLPDYSGLYVLDNGNSRVVKLSKDGAYQAQYQAGLLKNAVDIDVSEADKKIYFLTGGKIYQITME